MFRAGCLILMVVLFTSFKSAYDMPEVGEQAPQFTIRSLNNDSLSLSDFKGHYVFLDFWASWCSPCRAKHQALGEVFDSLHTKTFRDSSRFFIISISLDTDSTTWVNGISRAGLSWPDHGCDLKGWKSEVVKRYGLSYLPYNFLVDRDGRIMAKGMSVDEIKANCYDLFQN